MSWHAIVTIEPGGREIRLARTSLAITDSLESRTYPYDAALVDVAIPPIIPGEARSQVSIPVEYLDFATLREAGIQLAGASAEVALWSDGDDWSDRVILLTGRVEPNGVTRDDTVMTLQLSDFAEQLNRQFPPGIITSDQFANLNAQDDGKTYNVLYGAPARDVPVTLVDAFSATNWDEGVRLIIAGHRLASTAVSVRPKGRAALEKTVEYGFDHTTGTTFAFVTVTPNEIQGASEVSVNVHGHAANGHAVTGLGSVIEHLLLTYSGLPEDRLDFDRLGRFIPRADRLAVMSMFGGDTGGTLFGVMQQRYQEPLGIRLDWRNGRFGADLLAFDLFDPVVAPLRIGYELIERVGPIVQTTQGGDGPFSSFAISYDPDISNLDTEGNPALREKATLDARNDARCAEAESRFGMVPYPVIQVPDVNLVNSANVVLDWTADRRAVHRTRVQYLAQIDDVIRLPILRTYAVTDLDRQAGWTDERFRLESIQPREDGLAIVTLLSESAGL